MGSEKLLVVDDDKDICTIIAMMLERYGYDVLTSNNIANAKTIIDKGASLIDLLITDVRLKNECGVDLCHYYLDNFNDGKVMFITGNADLNGDSKLLDSANIIIVQKPFSPSELCNIVKTFLDGD